MMMVRVLPAILGLIGLVVYQSHAELFGLPLLQVAVLVAALPMVVLLRLLLLLVFLLVTAAVRPPRPVRPVCSKIQKVSHLGPPAVQVQVRPDTPPDSTLAHRKSHHGGQYQQDAAKEETAAGNNSVWRMFVCLQILYGLVCLSYLHQPLEDVLHLYPGHAFTFGTVGDPRGGRAKGRKEKREQP